MGEAHNILPKAHIFAKILVRWLNLGPFAAGQEKAKSKSSSVTNPSGVGGDNIQPQDINSLMLLETCNFSMNLLRNTQVTTGPHIPPQNNIFMAPEVLYPVSLQLGCSNGQGHHSHLLPQRPTASRE